MSKYVFLAVSLLIVMTGVANASTSAWVFVNDSGSTAGGPPFPPAPDRSYNPSGGAMSVSRTNFGTYRIRFVGLAPLASTGTNTLGGTVQLTTFLTTLPAAPPQQIGTCTILGWAKAGNDVLIDVRCYGLNGALKNTRFTLLYTFN